MDSGLADHSDETAAMTSVLEAEMFENHRLEAIIMFDNDDQEYKK